MLVKRQKEIDAFVQKDYWELKTKYREVIFTAAIDRLQSAERAEKGLEYLKQNLFEIIAFEIKEGKEKNPRLFDLIRLHSLQHLIRKIRSKQNAVRICKKHRKYNT